LVRTIVAFGSSMRTTSSRNRSVAIPIIPRTPSTTGASADCLRASIRRRTSVSRISGSSILIGNVRNTKPNLLPSLPPSASPRKFTGIAARNSRSATSSPLPTRYRRNPPATAVTSTSFTVPPKLFLINLISASGMALDQAARFITPNFPFKRDFGSGLRATRRVAARPRPAPPSPISHTLPVS